MDEINCPNCGAHELHGRFCAYCGTQLFQDEPEELLNLDGVKDSYDIPVGEYIGCNCNVVLETNAIAIKQFFFSQSGRISEVRIPFDQIVGAYYFRPEDKYITWGYIVLRWTQNAHLPLPDRKKIKKLSFKENVEHSVITFDGPDEQVFYQIYCMVKSKAPFWVQSWIDNPPVSVSGQNVMVQSINFDAYFHQFSPHRDRAITALCKRTGMNRKTAKILIDEAFDQLQSVLYADDSSLAVRDLNRAVRRAVLENKKYTVKL